MRRRLRVIGLTVLALAAPAFALGGEAPSSGAQTLSVTAALNGCGLAGTTIACQIDAGWNALEDADYYTVSVTRPDGSVVEAGQSNGTSHAIVVPYVGPGVYSVQVAAWGTPPGKDEPEVLGQGEAGSLESQGEAAPPTESVEPAGDSDRAEDAKDPLPDELDADAGPPVVEPEPCGEAVGLEPAQPEPGQSETAAPVPAAPETGLPGSSGAEAVTDAAGAAAEPVAADEPGVAPVCP